MITRNFNLFLNAGKHIPLVINVNQYDHDEQWCFTLLNDNGEKYIPSTGAIVGIKADRLGIINSGTVNASGQVVINETEQMTAAVGKAVFELLIDDQTHGTANFAVLVEPKPGNNADFSESDLSLLQEAIEGTSAAAIAEGVGTWMDDNLEPGEWVIDSSLTVQGAAADAKKVGDEISDLKSQINRGGLTEDFKSALYNLVTHIGVWTDGNAQTYIDDLYDAMNPPTNLSYITAEYSQGGTIYDTDTLNDLKSDLVVTAHYDDLTTDTITTYALSGTLEEGTSTITVTYMGKTTTFDVTVTHSPVPAEYTPLDYLSSNTSETPSAQALLTTPFIRTDFPSSDTDIFNYTLKLVYECNFNTVAGIPFGGRNANSNSATRGCVLYLGDSDTITNYGNKSGQTAVIRTATGVAVSTNEKHTFVFNKGKVTLDGESFIATDATSAVQLSTYKWNLFGRNNGGSDTVSDTGGALSPMIGKIYEFSLTDGNGDYVFNFEPCKRKADNVYGMYETVSETFYTSANAYGFIGGYDE